MPNPVADASRRHPLRARWAKNLTLMQRRVRARSLRTLGADFTHEERSTWATYSATGDTSCSGTVVNAASMARAVHHPNVTKALMMTVWQPSWGHLVDTFTVLVRPPAPGRARLTITLTRIYPYPYPKTPSCNNASEICIEKKIM